MAQVIWMEPALSDLNAIEEYIALDKPSAAIYLVKFFSLAPKDLNNSQNLLVNHQGL